MVPLVRVLPMARVAPSVSTSAPLTALVPHQSGSLTVLHDVVC
jgi:hypothetical protein